MEPGHNHLAKDRELLEVLGFSEASLNFTTLRAKYVLSNRRTEILVKVLGKVSLKIEYLGPRAKAWGCRLGVSKQTESCRFNQP